MTCQPFPIRLPPAEGEALTSLVERVAQAHNANVSDIGEALGIGQVALAPYENRLLTLNDQEVAAVAAGLSLTEQQVRDMLLTRLVPGYAAWSRNSTMPKAQNAVRLQGDRHRRKWCPQCLASPDGVWLLHWHLTTTFACIRHRAVLAAHCHVCGKHPVNLNNKAPTRWGCPTRHGTSKRHTLCPGRLLDTPQPTAPARVLAAQRTVHAAATGDTVQVAGVHVPGSTLAVAAAVVAGRTVIKVLPEVLDLADEMDPTGLSSAAVREARAVQFATLSTSHPNHGVWTFLREHPVVAAAAFTVAVEALTEDDWQFRLMRCASYGVTGDRSIKQYKDLNPNLPDAVHAVLYDALRRHMDLNGRLAGKPPRPKPHSSIWSPSRLAAGSSTT